MFGLWERKTLHYTSTQEQSYPSPWQHWCVTSHCRRAKAQGYQVPSWHRALCPPAQSLGTFLSCGCAPRLKYTQALHTWERNQAMGFMQGIWDQVSTCKATRIGEELLEGG